MKRNWLIIPEFEQREAFAELAEQYNAGFEYNDFYLPGVYENEEEIERRIAGYCDLKRDRSRDTLHGAFLDVVISSDDSAIAEYSKKRFRQSMEIARRLSIKGVVFHSGLVRGVTYPVYLKNWADRQEAFYRELCAEYPELTVYLENTQESSPLHMLPLLERMKDCSNFKFCLDYAHATISGTSVEDWVSTFEKYTAHMHINDNDLCSDLHQVPGDGCIDWKKFKTLTANMEQASVLIELRGLEQQRKSLEYVTGI